MKKLASILALAAVAVTGCKKDKAIDKPTATNATSNNNDDSTKTKPPFNYPTIVTKYYGQSHDWCDCDQRRDDYFADSFAVHEFLNDTTYDFAGSGPLSTPKTFRKSTTNTYQFHEQNRSYYYRLVGDSIYASLSITHGQCWESYSFKGKKK